MQAVWELVAEFLIFGAFGAFCAAMFGRRVDLFGLVVFALAMLAAFVAFLVWADVSGYNELTP